MKYYDKDIAYLKKVNRRIKEEIDKRNWTIKEVSSKTGLSQTRVRQILNYETYLTNISVTVLDRFACAFNLQAWELLIEDQRRVVKPDADPFTECAADGDGLSDSLLKRMDYINGNGFRARQPKIEFYAMILKEPAMDFNPAYQKE